MVGPTNLNPRFFRSLETSSERGDVAGISSIDFRWWSMTFPSVKAQI